MHLTRGHTETGVRTCSGLF